MQAFSFKLAFKSEWYRCWSVQRTDLLCNFRISAAVRVDNVKMAILRHLNCTCFECSSRHSSFLLLWMHLCRLNWLKSSILQLDCEFVVGSVVLNIYLTYFASIMTRNLLVFQLVSHCLLVVRSITVVEVIQAIPFFFDKRKPVRPRFNPKT